MADKNDYSEVMAEMLIQLRKPSVLLDGMQQAQKRIINRFDRSEAGFHHFASAVLNYPGAIRSDLHDIRSTVLQNYEKRLYRLEGFVRRAS